ncbi:restriction endonuclease subunit S [Leptospira borgpetersenii]|nr:restriction endonuclease subunit S [Leptospira borgpetersenii]
MYGNQIFMKNVKLAELVISLESGGRPKGGAIEEIDGAIPSIGAEHLNNDGGFNLKNIKYIPKKYFKELSTGIIKTEDILIVKDGATTGKTSFVSSGFPFTEAAVNEHVFILKLDKQLANPQFVFQFLRSKVGRKQILNDFRGATVGGISKRFVEIVQVPLPPLSEQIQIAEILT